MSASKRLRFPGILLSIVALVVLSVVGMSGVSAKGQPLTKEHSFAVFYTKTAPEGRDTTPCTSNGCANGIQFNWSEGKCFHGDRYLPIQVVWTDNGRLATTAWILTAPCGTGLQFSWDTNNHLNGAKWVGASSAATFGGLAICFRYDTGSLRKIT